MEYEDTIIGIIGNAGSARSFAMEAMANAREGKLDEAAQSLDEARQSLLEAHNVHAELLTADAQGKLGGASLLTIHAEDQLNAAVIVIDIADECIQSYTRIAALEDRIGALEAARQ